MEGEPEPQAAPPPSTFAVRASRVRTPLYRAKNTHPPARGSPEDKRARRHTPVARVSQARKENFHSTKTKLRRSLAQVRCPTACFIAVMRKCARGEGGSRRGAGTGTRDGPCNTPRNTQANSVTILSDLGIMAARAGCVLFAHASHCAASCPSAWPPLLRMRINRTPTTPSSRSVRRRAGDKNVAPSQAQAEKQKMVANIRKTAASSGPSANARQFVKCNRGSLAFRLIPALLGNAQANGNGTTEQFLTSAPPPRSTHPKTTETNI